MGRHHCRILIPLACTPSCLVIKPTSQPFSLCSSSRKVWIAQRGRLCLAMQPACSSSGGETTPRSR